LKCVLASRLHCLDYRQCFGLDAVIAAFWPDSFDVQIMNILHQAMDFVASIRADLDTVADVSIFSLMFSQALFMSSLSLKFSKAANLCENLTWCCFLTSSSISYLRLILSTSDVCVDCLLTYYQSFPNFWKHQTVIGNTVSFSKQRV
jgi:hypothetical protein